MVRLVLIVITAAVLGLVLSGGASANPFTGTPHAPAEANLFSGEASPTEAGEPVAIERASGPLVFVGRMLLTFQGEANRMIAQHMRAIREGETSVPLLIGTGLAFLYGVIHALGPGHGKIVVVSYFLSREARIGRGLLMGLQIAIFHVLSAMVVVGLADLLLRKAFGGSPAEVAGVRLASYGLIAVIGAVMTAAAARRSYLRRQGVDVGNACSCDVHAWDHHDPGHCDTGERVQRGALSLGVGMVPCTGAVLILLYALANGIMLAGMLLVTSIAAGMASTMGALGVLSVVARRAVARRVEAVSHGPGRFTVAMDYAGALAITALGGGLLWAAL
jgi:nickel/cobalt transporter (NicO) family protein